MKKSIKKTVISLALCASASCIVGGASLLRSKQQVVSAATTTAYYTLDGFTIDDSASVRNTSPNGIRFKTILSQETRDAIAELNLSDVSYGTLMLPADLLGSNELTHKTSSILDVETALWQDDEQTTWTSVLAGTAGSDLSENYYNRPIVARSYVTGTDGSGNTVYYYTENTTFRSIGYVAMMEYLAPTGKVTELIETIVEKTDVELVFNDAGMVSVAQNETEGTTLISNKLSSSSDSVATLRIGGMLTLASYSFLPEITYDVENEAVISVSGSTLTAKKEGETVVTANCTFNDKSLTVSKKVSTTGYKGTSDYKILITDEAKNSPDILVSDFTSGGQSSRASFERAAAEKLQSVFLEATGIELPIVTSESGSEKYISIGETALATANTELSPTVTAKDTASEVFVKGENVYIRGSVANESILYGVQKFLGDTVGYQFFMENTHTTDTNVEVVVNAKTYVPDVEYNVVQSDVRSDGVMDDYMMQSYTRNVIALGITEEEETTAHYKGVAHNTVYVVNNGMSQSSSSPRYSTGQSPWKTWYATYQGGLFNGTTYYRTIDDPNTKETDYIMAELCYTAHGVSDNTNADREAMIKIVADEMLTELAQYRSLYRLGFSHMDHRYWCECSNCKNDGNPSDNLLEFLLDVSAAVKARWSETGRDDGDKELFKISSLFYHRTLIAPKSTANYADKLSAYGKHVEIWFAESAGDYVVPITDPSSAWNAQILTNMNAFASLANTYGMDLLWWTYEGMVAQFFVPYNSIYALRENYAKMAELGFDYKFNQLMMSKVNFTRLKEYLISKLQWDADVDATTYEAWIKDYFDGAYGAGSEKMQEYFTEWKTWATNNQSTFINTADWADIQDGTTGTNDASTWNDEVLMGQRKTYFPEATLQKWIDLIDQAIAALDPNDPNYETYYWNMKLEKLTPLYLMLYVHGGNNTSNTTDTAGVLLATGTFSTQSYVLAYGQEFLDISTHWDSVYFGEGRLLTDFNAAIQTILDNGGATSTKVESRQTVVAGSSFTLSNAALVDGNYTVSVVNAKDIDDKPTATVSVSGGVATITATLTAGESYIVEMKSSGKIVKFTNVLAISGYITTVDQLKSMSGGGYYLLANDINCANATLNAISFTGILDGDNKTVSNFTVGANGMFAAEATVKNVTFEDFTVAGGTIAQDSVFGTASAFENVNVKAENPSGYWDNGINVNYVKAEKKAYVVSGQKDTTLYDAIFVKGNTYTVTIDGVDTTVTAYTNGKLNLTVGAMLVGAQKTVLCRASGSDTTYVFDVIGITKFITNLAELSALGVGGYVNGERDETRPYDSKVAGNDVSGYYALANDIDCYGEIIYPGHNYGESNFIGVFDGNGYTISNFTTGDSGIFGGLKNATIKDVKFDKVSITNVGAAIPGWNYGALLAHTATNTKFENISASYVSLKFNVDDVDDSNSTKHSTYYNGLFVGYRTNNVHYENVLFDVTKVEKVYAIFGPNVSGLTCNDVTIYMKASLENWMSSQYGGVIYGYTGTKEVANMILNAPNGVSIVQAFSITNPEREIAAGDSLTITTNNDTGKTITFSLESAVDGVDIDPVTGEVEVADFVLPNTTFTVVAAIEGFADKVTFTVSKYETALDKNIVISKEDGVFTLPAEISGTVEYVKLGDVTLYNAKTSVGSVMNGVYTADSFALENATTGAGQTLTVGTEMTKYTLTATVATKYIKTTQELRDLGVGGKVYTDRTPSYNNSVGTVAGAGGNGNSGVAGNDVTGYYVLANDLDFADENAVAAGYTFQQSWFRGTFDGNGHTIRNITVNEGGIFGGMFGATVKDVNFENVVYDLTLGLYAGQYSQQVALLAHVASNSTFEDINVQISEYKMNPSGYVGMLFVYNTWNQNTIKDVYIDASGVMVDQVLSIDGQSQTEYDNVTIIAEGYNKIGVLGSTAMTEFPANVTFMHCFTITNATTEIEIGSSFDVTVSNNTLDITYALKEAVNGVSIGGNTVNVSANAAIGATFTVVATSSEGYVQEITFTVAKGNIALDGTVAVEAITDTLDLSGINGISGNILSIKITSSDANVEDLTIYSGSTTAGEIAMSSRPVKMAHLGENKSLVLETASAVYTVNANVYTMIIDNATELEQFYNVAAENAVDAGLCIEAQKGFVHSGYFTLNADIEYNKVWAHIPFGTRWAACYANNAIWTDETKTVLVDGAIVEDWGAGEKGGFRGVFDGKGYAIKGLELKGEYAGFIGTMGVDGVLKNVAFTDLVLGQKTGLVERGGRGGFVENVYVELDSIESGVDQANPTKIFSQHGHTKLTNVVINATECNFTGIEYVYLANSAYNVSENVYVTGTNLAFAKTAFDEANGGMGATAFWHFNTTSDSGALFDSVSTLMADADHGAVVSSLGGYWRVENDKFYFGDVEIVDALAEIYDDTEYVNDTNHQITFNDAAFTVGSVWTMTVAGMESEVAVETEGKLTVTIDAMAINAQTTTINFASNTTELNFTNVRVITYIKTAADLKALGMGENNTTATADLKGYYVLANNITFEHEDDYSDVVAAGYHKAGGATYQHLWSFQGVFDGNGFKIDNMRVSDGGIFGYAENATIKNLVLTNVHLIDNVPAEISKQSGGYASILAYAAPGSTFEDIQITIASSPASVWTWKRDGLFVVNGSDGTIYRDIMVDASYIELKTLLGIHHKDSAVYENVVIKAANYVAIGYTADSYGAGGVQNVAAMMTEFPDGVTFERIAYAEIPNQPLDTSYAKLTAYTGDETALGFAEGSYVFAVENTNLWNDRILFPADSDNYDYVEFDVVFSTAVGSLTAWPSSGSGTQGSMSIYGSSMVTSDGVTRTIHVYDKDGNTMAAQYRGGFAANTFYTIRVCFADGETLKYFHLGMGTAQTYYVSNARWGNLEDHNDVYDSTTGALHAKYEGDVTALGFAEDTVVTAVTIDSDWSDRVGVNTSIKYDYVDVQFAFSSEGAARNLCLWMYNIDATIIQGNYLVNTTGGIVQNSAAERKIQVFNLDGSAVTEATFTTGKAYVLRVYLNDNTSAVAISTSGASESSTSVLCFGDITFGNAVTVNETVEISTADGSFTLPAAVEGTVTAVTVDGTTVYSKDVGSINGDVITTDVELTAGTGKVMVIYTDGDTYTLSATVTAPFQPGYAVQNTSNVEFTAYSGDTTSMGFKAGDNVYEIVNTSLWTDRILIPADSDNYDYVEFDVYPTVKVSAFTAWPSNGSGTQGSFGIYGAQMNPTNSVIRSVHVWDANGNTFKAQYTSGFEANTFYTIRVCFAEGETLKFLHFGTGTAQTYYISSARWGNFDVQNDVYTNATGALLPKYEGDVTALGFDAGSTVTQVSLAGDAWGNRVGLYGNVKYDYVDVEFSFTGDRTVYSLCVWAYGTSAAILTGNYTVTVNGGTPANNASERKIQIFDTEYNAVTALAKDTVYILRVFLNGDTSAIAVSTFDTSADSSAILNFGDITYGNAYESDEYIILLPATGSYTLPDDINGTVKYIYIDGTLIYSDTVGSLDGNTGMYDADFAIGTEYDVVVYTHENDTYYLKAIGADAIIKTAQELQALGVGGRTVDGVKQGQGNSDVAGNDVEGYYVIANDIDASGIYFAAGYTQYKSYFRGTVDGLGHIVNNVIVSEGGIFGGMYRATVKNVTFAGVRYHGSSCGQGYNNNQNWGQYFGLFAHWADNITVSNVKVVIDQMEHKDWKNVALFSNRFQTANVSTFTNVEVDATGIALNTALGYQHTGENIVYDNVSIKAASVNVIAYSDDGTTALTEWPTGITYTQDATLVQFEDTTKCMTYKYAGDVTELGFEAGTTVFVAEQDARSNMWAAGSVLGLTMERQKTMIYKNADEDYASIQFSVSRDITSYGSYLFFSWWYVDSSNQGGAGYLLSNGNASASNTAPTGFNAVAYNLDGTQATSFVANTVYELRLYGEGATAFGVGLAAQNDNPEMINVYWANPSSGNDAA